MKTCLICKKCGVNTKKQLKQRKRRVIINERSHNYLHVFDSDTYELCCKAIATRRLKGLVYGDLVLHEENRKKYGYHQTCIKQLLSIKNHANPWLDKQYKEKGKNIYFKELEGEDFILPVKQVTGLLLLEPDNIPHDLQNRKLKSQAKLKCILDLPTLIGKALGEETVSIKPSLPTCVSGMSTPMDSKWQKKKGAQSEDLLTDKKSKKQPKKNKSDSKKNKQQKVEILNNNGPVDAVTQSTKKLTRKEKKLLQLKEQNVSTESNAALPRQHVCTCTVKGGSLPKDSNIQKKAIKATNITMSSFEIPDLLKVSRQNPPQPSNTLAKLREVTGILHFGIFSVDTLSEVQMNGICSVLNEEILREGHHVAVGQNVLPVTYFTHHPGWMLLACQTQFCVEWLQRKVPNIRLWPETKLYTVPEEGLPKTIVVSAQVPFKARTKSMELMLQKLKSHNIGLNTEDWKVLYQHTGTKDIHFVIDILSAKALVHAGYRASIGSRMISFRMRASRYN